MGMAHDKEYDYLNQISFLFYWRVHKYFHLKNNKWFSFEPQFFLTILSHTQSKNENYPFKKVLTYGFQKTYCLEKISYLFKPRFGYCNLKIHMVKFYKNSIWGCANWKVVNKTIWLTFPKTFVQNVCVIYLNGTFEGDFGGMTS